MAGIQPTTKAQISGHRFLRRRVEHGLVMGDIRMIQDPLGARKRALFIGAGLSVVTLAGAGILAWMQPNPDPGEAPIVRTENGQLLALADGVYHPVPNLASARLIANTPANPAGVGAEHLGKLGSPAGLADAPGFLNAAPTQRPWALCQEHADANMPFDTQLAAAGNNGAATIVHADLDAQPLGEGRAALLVSEGRTWLWDADGRREIPGGDVGRAVERALGITGMTPRWAVPPEFLSAVPEAAPLRFEGDLPTIWDTGQGLWARSGAGVTRVGDVQAQVLAELGARREKVSPEAVKDLADAPALPPLPAAVPAFLAPSAGWLCAVDGVPAWAQPVDDIVPLGAAAGANGADGATHIGGLGAGGVAVDTGHARLIVSATGTRHTVSGEDAWKALGVDKAVEVPWPVVRLLPEGSELSRAAALKSGN